MKSKCKGKFLNNRKRDEFKILNSKSEVRNIETNENWRNIVQQLEHGRSCCSSFRYSRSRTWMVDRNILPISCVRRRTWLLFSYCWTNQINRLLPQQDRPLLRVTFASYHVLGERVLLHLLTFRIWIQPCLWSLVCVTDDESEANISTAKRWHISIIQSQRWEWECVAASQWVLRGLTVI